MFSFIKSNKAGSVLGGSLLLAGSCIGAGMLALPVITGISGFIPSLCMFIVAWLFMGLSGQVLLKVNLKLGSDLNLISLAERTLGRVGKWSCSLLFLFLFYCLSVAYIVAIGPICQSVVFDLFGISLSTTVYQLILSKIFAIIVYAGVRPVDLCNRLLMLGLGVAYVALVSVGAAHVDLDLLRHTEWRYAFSALPILIISFGYHNMLPSIAHYFRGDERRLTITVWIGTLLPLAVYLIWQFVMLGMIPQDEILQAFNRGEAATEALQRAVGQGGINTLGQLFAFFAIVTSFLAQSLSLVDFIADGLKVSKEGRTRLGLVSLAILPPLLLASWKPGLFLHALNLAGGLAAVLLFGLIPVLMTIKERVPSSRSVLIGLFVVAISLFTVQLCSELGFPLLPQVS